MRNYPTLKPGVTYVIEHHPNYSSIAVGTSSFGIRLNGHAAILFIQKANGQIELKDLISEIGISDGQALEIIQPLLTHNLLSLLNSPALSNIDDVSNMATKVSIERALPELNTLGWRNNLNPLGELFTREDREVQLLGSNRLTFALFKLFHAIGYSRTKIKSDLSGEIESHLIGATPFRMSDIGQSLSETNEKTNREYALKLSQIRKFRNSSNGLNGSVGSNGSSGSNGSVRDSITINTQDFAPEEIVDLSLDRSAHLQIGNLTAGKVEFGPIVIPGKTPCYNCISLWKSEKMSDLAKLKVAHTVAPPLELPAASVTYLAGLIVSLVDNYFALNKSFLLGSSVVINLLKPLEYVERFWQPNPLCGCLELL